MTELNTRPVGFVLFVIAAAHHIGGCFPVIYLLIFLSLSLDSYHVYKGKIKDTRTTQ